MAVSGFLFLLAAGVATAAETGWNLDSGVLPIILTLLVVAAVATFLALIVVSNYRLSQRRRDEDADAPVRDLFDR